MYDRILVPLDGSRLAEQVLPYVTRISMGMGIPVHLIQVIPTAPEMVMADPVHGSHRSEITELAFDQTINYLNNILETIDGAEVEVTHEVCEGEPASRIVEEADKSPATLVAMCTHGRSGVARWLMGSVTNKVLHSTKNPMLIIRSHIGGDPEGSAKLETIIVPVDGSSLAEQVIPHVAALANALDLGVTLLRVANTAEEFSAAAGYQRLDGISALHVQNFEGMAKQAGNQALDYLKGLEASLRRQGIASVDHRIERGQAAHAIVNVAVETPDNLVAMTTHGRSGPARWALGSVTERVVRHSGDPVLVVRVS